MVRYLLSHYITKGIFCFLVSSVILVSILSYDQIDPSWNLATSGATENLLGSFGAILSDLLIQSFGLTNIILVSILFNWSYLLIANRGMNFWYGARFIALLASLFFISTFLSQYTENIYNILADYFSDSGYGGIAGTLLKTLLSSYIPEQYLYLSCFGLGFIFICFALGYSFAQYKSFTMFTMSNSLRFLMLSLEIFAKGVLKLFSLISGNKRDYSMLGSKKLEMFKIPRKSKEKVSLKKIEPSNNGDGFELPSLDLFNQNKPQSVKKESREQLQENAAKLLEVLQDFGIKGDILDISQGPVVTLYEFEPAAGTKSSRIIGLADDIARSLCALSTRISVIPGRNVLGIELPNKEREFFFIKELFETDVYNASQLKLPLILGKDLAGKAYIADLAKMPHLLVAGTTGSGKSVAINAMIVSLLYRYTPEECKFIMIDPKMLELSVYDGIPHLLTPVVTEPSKAITALKWAVKEMENRYKLMSFVNVRNVDGYNEKIMQAAARGEVMERRVQTGFDTETGAPIYENIPIENKKLPYIVLIVDEMADLMLVAGKDIEASIQRLAQMARAAGIHIIMATQRPSVDVITGVIKANFPSRISFKVTSKIDSRTILAEQGAEQLLGMGDMLYMGSSSKLMRVHGPFIDDVEVENIARFLKSQGEPSYINAVTESSEDTANIPGEVSVEVNELYSQALAIVRKERKASTSFLQRCLKIGYNRAADLIDQLEKNGVISSANHVGRREVLLPEDA